MKTSSPCGTSQSKHAMPSSITDMIVMCNFQCKYLIIDFEIQHDSSIEKKERGEECRYRECSLRSRSVEVQGKDYSDSYPDRWEQFLRNWRRERKNWRIETTDTQIQKSGIFYTTRILRKVLDVNF